MPDVPVRLLDELNQVLAFGMGDGPRLVYEVARQTIYAGDPPWPLVNQQQAVNIPIQPFNFINGFNRRVPVPAFNRGRPDGNPIVTTLDAANPQLPEALGVDLITLVSQVLHDPAVLPPAPLTDMGPPTPVNAAQG